MKSKKVTILETTLRDGSYTINFGFTASDTEIICRELEEAGLEFIEVGHGVGLGASTAGYGEAVQTDEEYMQAAQRALTKAKYGMFCIPGIATLSDIDLAHRNGMGFIRIGTNVTHVAESEEFIKKAKKLGMFVAANYMKSYALSPEEFAKQVKVSEKCGADMVYIVDSAGGMFADDLYNYYTAIRKISDIPLGFHGHDNLGLAIANSIAAADMGIQFIDATLQGLGRSAGNASIEALVAALFKRGYTMPINMMRLFEIGQKYVHMLLQTKGRMPLDIVSGYAEFHSSYMPHIQKYAAKYSVDPALLIIEICKIDRVEINLEALDQIARRLQKEGKVYHGQYGFNRYIGGEQEKR